MSTLKHAQVRRIRLQHSLVASAIMALVTANAWAADDAASGPKVPEESDGQVATLDQITVVGQRPSNLSDVTVGGKVPLSVREIPNSVSVMTQQQIQDMNLVTVADALNFVTGITVTPNDGTQSQFKARGFTLAVMNDGVPAYNSLSGYQQLDLSIYERLEVLRGPGGVLQGSGEPGGTLNVVRKRGLHDFAVSSSLSLGSWSNYRAVVDVGGPLNERKTVRGRFVGSWQDRDFFVDVTSNQRTLAYGVLDWDLAPSTTLSVSVASQDDETVGPFSGLPAWTTGGLLDVPRSTNVAQEWEKYIWETKDYVLGFEHRFQNEWVAKFSVSRRDQRFFFKDSYNTTGVDPSNLTVAYARRENDYDYRREALDWFVAGPVKWFGRSHHLLGGYNHDSLVTRYGGVTAPAFNVNPGLLPLSYWNNRVLFDRPDLVPDFNLAYTAGGLTETQQSGFYAQGRFSLSDPLTVVLGGRLSDFEVRTRTQPPGVFGPWRQTFKRDNEFTPYGGLVYDLNNAFSLYASYADIFVPQAGSLLKIDGGSLDPRIGKQYEIGSKAEFLDGKLNASVAVFRLRDTGRSMADPDNPGFYVNAGEVESSGWETEVSGSPAPGYELTAGYTRLSTEWLTAAAALQGQKFDAWEPKHSFKLWAVKRFAELGQPGLTVGLGLIASSGTEAGTGSDAVRAQGGYTVVSAMAGYRFNARFSLNFNANNLFDKTYYARLGGVNSYNTFGDPRNYSLTARLNF